MKPFAIAHAETFFLSNFEKFHGWTTLLAIAIKQLNLSIFIFNKRLKDNNDCCFGSNHPFFLSNISFLCLSFARGNLTIGDMTCVLTLSNWKVSEGDILSDNFCGRNNRGYTLKQIT